MSILGTDKDDVTVAPTETFQSRVEPWLHACFGPEIAGDKIERNHRFLEEALELVQSTGCTQSEAHQLVDYVYGREIGEPVQEVGGVMNTLAALCLAHGMDMHEAGETELVRVWAKVEAIRAKQAAKPKHSPLPMHVAPAPTYVNELEKALGALIKLNDEHSPFGGEMYQDRIERTWDKARAALAAKPQEGGEA